MNAELTAQKKTLDLDSNMNWESHQSPSTVPKSSLPFSEEVDLLLAWQKIPHGMTCCCDIPYLGLQNCNFLCTPSSATPLSHLFAKSTMVLLTAESRNTCFQVFQKLIRNHLASGGTITEGKNKSFWMTLMEASYRLVILNDGLIATPSTLKSKAALSTFSPLIGSLLPMNIHHTGGPLGQLEELAETLYGAALQEYITTKRQAHLQLVTRTQEISGGK